MQLKSSALYLRWTCAGAQMTELFYLFTISFYISCGRLDGAADADIFIARCTLVALFDNST